MFRERLMELGKRAVYLRMRGEEASCARITEAIDRVAAEWRAAEPHLFWNDNDPLYRELCAKWARLRELKKRRR